MIGEELIIFGQRYRVVREAAVSHSATVFDASGRVVHDKPVPIAYTAMTVEPIEDETVAERP